MQDIRIFTQAAGQDQGQVEGNLWASYRQAVGKLKARLRSRLKTTYRQAVGKLHATYMQPMGQLSLAAGCFKARHNVCKCVENMHAFNKNDPSVPCLWKLASAEKSSFATLLASLCLAHSNYKGEMTQYYKLPKSQGKCVWRDREMMPRRCDCSHLCWGAS